MNFLSKIGAIALCTLALCSCGSSGFEAETATALCDKSDSSQQLSYDDFAQMIEQERLAFDSRESQMKQLLDIADKQKFAEQYQQLRNDKEFMTMTSISERMWRILVLNQGGFSEENSENFAQLFNQHKIIDLLDDDILSRLGK
jgi:hypothetical protein